MASQDPITRLNAALEGRYRIERQIGEGGMATVYLARELKHDRDVAIKVMNPELVAGLGAERFLREIDVVATLTHPHILPLHDSGEADGLLYYIMPYFRGESLRDRLERETRLAIPDAIRIASEVAGALAFAHARGIVHRDVKPSNILLEGAHAVLADFGVTKAPSAPDDPTLTHTGMLIGTPHYMSPEQTDEKRVIDGRSDQYALGCVLYEMLTGEPPFTGRTGASVFAKHLTEPPPDVTQVRPDAPPEVRAALERALAKKPENRFDSASDFASALGGTYVPPTPRRPLTRVMASALAVLTAGVLFVLQP